MSAGWSTPADLEARVRRRWADGSLLRAWAAGDPFPEVDLRLHAPKPAEIGDDLDAVRRWVSALESGSRHRGHERYVVDYAQIGGRLIGRNQLPQRVRVTCYDQAWRLLGVTDQVEDLARIRDVVRPEPAVHDWVAANPLTALTHLDDWPRLLAAYRWLSNERDSDRYLREISAPGVDTKFVERRRSVLAALLEVPASSAGFIRALGLRAKPETVRVRFAPGTVAGLPTVTEASLRLDELARAQWVCATAVIVENEITYLSLPIPIDGVVIWGKGFDVSHAGSLPWLQDAAIHYWGDLDTHGFAILHQLRAWLSQTQSFLMDRDTLLAHRDRWGHEDSPTAARLDRLSADEHGLYADLVSDRYADAVRLEQERIDWSWVSQRLPYMHT